MREIFDPVLTTPNPLNVNDEQQSLIKQILDVSSSDSRFALKAYIAIMKVLLGEFPLPLIVSIDPSEGAAGGDPVEVTITGENFEAASVVLQAGAPILSSYVNPTTLTASILLSGAAEGVLAISVKNPSQLVSNVVNFTVTPAVPLTQVANEASGFKAEVPTIPSISAVVASAEEPAINVPDGGTTDLDELKARIAAMNATDVQSTDDPNTQFNASQQNTPMEGEK